MWFNMWVDDVEYQFFKAFHDNGSECNWPVVIQFWGAGFFRDRCYSGCFPGGGYCSSPIGFPEEVVEDWGELCGTVPEHPRLDAFRSPGLAWLTPAQLPTHVVHCEWRLVCSSWYWQGFQQSLAVLRAVICVKPGVECVQVLCEWDWVVYCW